MIGYPNAKSLLWVQNTENNPDFSKSTGLVTRRVITATVKKTQALAKSTEARNFQLTELKSRLTIDMKMVAGSANVPTKVFKPFASVTEMMFNLPATYL